MVDISREKNEKNRKETIVGNDGILWLNEKLEGLNHKNLWMNTEIFQAIENVDIKEQMSQKTTRQKFYRQNRSNQSNHGL